MELPVKHVRCIVFECLAMNKLNYDPQDVLVSSLSFRVHGARERRALNLTCIHWRRLKTQATTAARTVKCTTTPCRRALSARRTQEKLESLGPNGRIHIEVRYLPFVAPEVQEEAMKKLEKERLKANAKTQLRRRATRSTLDMRGVLTVNVHRCINLEACAAARGQAKCRSPWKRSVCG